MQHFIDFSIPTKASPNYVQQFALQKCNTSFHKRFNRVKILFCLWKETPVHAQTHSLHMKYYLTCPETKNGKIY